MSSSFRLFSSPISTLGPPLGINIDSEGSEWLRSVQDLLMLLDQFQYNESYFKKSIINDLRFPK